jgi:NAD(P)-dependent dehydrogenase (short-subunit alcohol dehydrogenase family)
MTNPDFTYRTLPANYIAPDNVLKDRVILVTGAGQGLGYAAALAFAKHGATVILHGRTLTKLEAVYDEIEAAGGAEPAMLPLDFLVATQADLDGFAHSIYENFGRLDGIFHGASYFAPLTPLSSADLDAWLKHTRVNLSVPAALTTSCTLMLKRSISPAVVWLSETHAVKPTPYWGVFGSTKAALGPLATIWQGEVLEADGIRFTVCVPGPVASPMRAKSHPGELASLLPSPMSLTPHFVYLMSPNNDINARETVYYACAPQRQSP